MNSLKVFLTLSLLTSILACNSSDGDNRKWKEFDHKEFGVEYPADWDLDISGSHGTAFILYSKETVQGDTFKENISLMIRDFKGQNMTLEEFGQVTEAQVTNLVKGSNVEENETYSGSNGDYRRVVYTGWLETRSHKIVQQCWIKNETAYILTFNSEQGAFQDFEKDFERIFESFEVK